jgi:ribose transport system ATP-binding protein
LRRRKEGNVVTAAGDSSAGSSPPALEISNISKTFEGQVALLGVSLTLHAGRIHGLLGQNGSGKSTLIKILSGYHQPDPGAQGTVAGEDFTFGSATAAHQAGLRFIHQELDLIDDLSILDNLALTRGYAGSPWWLSLRSEARQARKVLGPFLPNVQVDELLGNLTQAEKSLLAIARAVVLNADGSPIRVLILDEPTVALPGPDVERLFDAIRSAARAGVAVLYVSHNLNEVLRLVDSLTILRDGRVVAERPRAALVHDDLVQLIVGSGEARVRQGITPPLVQDDARVVLQADELVGTIVNGLSIQVRTGEIVGVAGLAGSGREELPYLFSGARTLVRGTVRVDGTQLHRLSPAETIKAGIAFVAADRRSESAVQEFTARENVTLPRLPTRGPLRWLSLRSERADARRWMVRAGAPAARAEDAMHTFSGGNQQKIVLARALRLRPKLLVLDQPMQGVDIGAKSAIARQIAEAAADGMAVLVSATDVEDLEMLCHRVVIMSRGRIVRELTGDDVHVDAISRAILAKEPVPDTVSSERGE